MLSEELDAEITRRFSKNPPRRNFTTLNSILTDMIQHESAIISVTRQHIMDTTGLEDSNVLRYLANIEHIITEEDLDLLPELSKETPSLCTFEYLEQAKELIEYYYANKNNFAHSSNTDLIEFVRPFFPPVEFNEMVEEGIFNES